MILSSEILKDIIKIAGILVPFIFVLIKGRVLLAKDRKLLVLIAGFIFVLSGFVMDYFGDIPAFEALPFLGSGWPMHEVAEDILGGLGFLLFILGVTAEVSHMEFLNRENSRLIAQLNESNKKLAKSNELKSAFVATVSHEVRVVLSTSKLAVENLRDQLKQDLSDMQVRTMDILHSSVSRLARIVDDLLDLAKIEAGKMPLKRELVDLRKAFEEAVFSQRQKAEAKNITISEEYEGGDFLIWCDRDKIMQAALNLLNNALKFTPAGGRVALALSQAEQPEEIEIKISDTGPGISSEQKEKMFNKFESQNLKDQEGTGLGLSITKEIIEMHRGVINVVSSPGEGCAFIIRLPRDLRAVKQKAGA